MKKNLKDHACASCHVVIDGNRIDFISYSTRVITLDYDAAGNRRIECTGTYSATTSKQIGWFLREYAPDISYQQVKKIAGNGAVAM